MGVQVEVRRSRRRRRTVQARRDGDKIVVMVPDNLTRAEERAVVTEMVAKVERRERRGPHRRSDSDLMERAAMLSDRYLGGIARPTSVRWVSNQRSRWGSCTPDSATIRLSERLQGMPEWVVDYVLVHELVHLIEPGHDAAFWGWVANYPHTEKAKGYLIGWSDAQGVERPPSGEQDDVD